MTLQIKAAVLYVTTQPLRLETGIHQHEAIGRKPRDCQIALVGAARIEQAGVDGAADRHRDIIGAKPLAHNEYKLGLVKDLVRSALTELSQ